MKAAKTRALHKKHAGTSKHVSTAKHTPTAHKKAATAHKQVARRTASQVKAAHARALSLGDVSCCTADALAWSLRAAGWPVEAADVLALYKLTADSADAGASIVATLDAAYVFGLGGVRPLGFGLAEPDAPGPLVLGVDLPGRHSVLALPDGSWLTWGVRYPPAHFPDAVIEEAWAVTWP
jgi:hypothetical protein